MAKNFKARPKKPKHHAPAAPRPRFPRGQEPSLPALRESLAAGGIQLPHAALEKLWTYHSLLRKHNTDRDLTRIIGFEAIVLKHYVDCLMVPDLIRLPAPLLDVGTGAGFPGIPLKIRVPSLKMILAEPRPRRVMFLNLSIRQLGLKDIHVFDHKVTSRSFTKPIQGVITRAVEPMFKTALRTSGALARGGQIIFMKGPNADDEIREMKERFSGEFKLRMDKPYKLARSPHQRRLVVFERLIDPSPSLSDLTETDDQQMEEDASLES